MRELFTEVDLGDGVSGVIVEVLGCPPGAPGNGYEVEVFLSEDSMGDDVITMVEAADGSLYPSDPEKLAEIRGRQPNTWENYNASYGNIY